MEHVKRLKKRLTLRFGQIAVDQLAFTEDLSPTGIFIKTTHIIQPGRPIAELNLHIDLLAEHEVTKAITLLTAIAERMGLEESRNPELEELTKDVHPEKVLDRMTQVEQENAEKEEEP